MKRGAMLRSFGAGLACLLAVETAAAEPTTAAQPAPAPPPEKSETSVFSPPAIVWPVYVLGAIGIGGLGTAAVFGGLHANASHGLDVSTQALVRNGQTPATCDARPVEVYYAEICAHLGKNRRLAESHESIFVPALIVGVSATALAIGWFFLAPKPKVEKGSATRVVPWMGVSGGGATVEGRF